jgi:hypothetical protein
MSIYRQFSSPLLLVVFIFSNGAGSLFAQEFDLYDASEAGFTQRYPRTFVPVPISMPGVALSLRPIDGGFPTFNVIVEPCDPRLKDLALEKLSERLESDYRRVGLTDTKATHAEALSLQNWPAFRFELQYKNKAKEFVSSVMRVHTSEHCFVLTYIDFVSEYPNRAFIRNQLEAGFSLLQSRRGFDATSSPELLPYLVGFAGLVFLAALYLRNRRRRMPR